MSKVSTVSKADGNEAITFGDFSTATLKALCNGQPNAVDSMDSACSCNGGNFALQACTMHLECEQGYGI